MKIINILFITVFFLSFAHPMYSSGPGSLVGSWIWLEDQDGTHPVKDSQCTLVFFKDGTVIVSCHKPGQTAKGIGTYSIKGATGDGGMLTLEIPDYGKSANNQSYRLENDILTLPFTLIGEGNWSRWQREPEPAETKDSIPVIAYRAYETALMNGASDEAAAEAALKAVKEKLHSLAYAHESYLPAGEKIKPLYGFLGSSALCASFLLNSPVTLDQAILNASKTTIKVKQEGNREYYILLKSKMPSLEDYLHRPAKEPIKPATFVRDPRTHLYMQKCQGPDDPARHRALLLFPMHTQRVYRKGCYSTFKGVGEDPKDLKRQHQRAGYPDNDIIVKKDSDVTPRLIYDQVRQNPGVLYISSHGDLIPAVSGNEEFVLLTGLKLNTRKGETLQQAFARVIATQNLPKRYEKGIVAVTLSVNRWDVQFFVGLTEAFFRELRKECDLSGSLVFLDACKSTKRPEVAKIFNARVFMGWEETVDPLVSVRYCKYIFNTLVRKTYSAREAWYRLGRTLSTRRSIHQEDKLLDDSDSTTRTALTDSYKKFTVYGSDHKPYPSLGKLYRGNTENGVFWLLWLARWNQNPQKASNNLISCYNQAWSKEKRPGRLKLSPLCNAGYRGTYKPKRLEVREARQLINGDEGPVPGGRFTLADSLDYRSEF
jgi:hypothetical protein